MFLFVMQAIKRDSRIVTEPLRDQVATGNNKVALKIFIQDGFIYTKVNIFGYLMNFKMIFDLKI